MSASRRLLLVHAHPDDETIGTGATMARYAAEGASVTLVTCTLGELGEVLVPSLAQLSFERADQLGGYRISELAAAMDALGVRDHRFLGGAGGWRDSGMADTVTNADPRAFWSCDSDPARFDLAVGQLAAVIREVRPQVLITYDQNGSYGHPDHIMAHRVAMAAVDRAAAPDADAASDGSADGSWQIEKVYWTAVPRSVILRHMESLEPGAGPEPDATRLASAPPGDPDEEVTTALDCSAYVVAKTDALRAHATQLVVRGDMWALPDDFQVPIMGTEWFRLVRGTPAGPFDSDGRETDLFAGVDESAFLSDDSGASEDSGASA